MLVLGVVINARMVTVLHAPDLPQRFLPGNPLPAETAYTTLSDEHSPRCVVYLSDDDVYFSFDAETRIINRTVIPAQKYAVGDLMSAWGIPTGITRNETNIYIHWGAHLRCFTPGRCSLTAGLILSCMTWSNRKQRCGVGSQPTTAEVPE